ncbi:MAG: SoxR reducing system RseC family protein, partial [Deltaproteobacteria bacterium]|nr:SoxR reducing system RseC family protein [Deltaproteobacteria bacterium]
MPRHEGIVTCVKEDGSAQVYIKPGESGIPGAPDANVCHCATESSNIFIEAVNSAGASSGDRVSVYLKASVLIRNAVTLIAIPLAGTLLGILLGMGLNDGVWKTSAAAAPAAAGM